MGFESFVDNSVSELAKKNLHAKRLYLGHEEYSHLEYYIGQYRAKISEDDMKGDCKTEFMGLDVIPVDLKTYFRVEGDV